MTNRGHLLAAVAVGLVLTVGACADDRGDAAPLTTTSTTTTTTLTTTTTTTAALTTTTEAPRVTAETLCANAGLEAGDVLVGSDLLTEVSGIAASRQHQGLIWAHNDSGGEPRVHLIGADGADLGQWYFDGAEAFDWEDMAIGPGPDDVDHLYAADFGDNFSIRTEVQVHRTPEPTDVTTAQPLGVETFTFTYPGGARDAESLLVDPISGDIHIISKSWDENPPAIYRAAATTETGTTTELQAVGALDLTGFNPLTTAAAISADGTVIALWTYADVLLWDRDPAESVADAMARPPCVAPGAVEQQGEAITFLPEGSGYVTISEGLNPPINRFVIPG
jgi:hypothetical protein